MTEIDKKLVELAAMMGDMASNDMGDLSLAEAGLFHVACDALDTLIASRIDVVDRDQGYDRAAERARMPDGSISASRYIAECDREDRERKP